MDDYGDECKPSSGGHEQAMLLGSLKQSRASHERDIDALFKVRDDNQVVLKAIQQDVSDYRVNLEKDLGEIRKNVAEMATAMKVCAVEQKKRQSNPDQRQDDIERGRNRERWKIVAWGVGFATVLAGYVFKKIIE